MHAKYSCSHSKYRAFGACLTIDKFPVRNIASAPGTSANSAAQRKHLHEDYTEPGRRGVGRPSVGRAHEHASQLAQARRPASGLARADGCHDQEEEKARRKEDEEEKARHDAQEEKGREAQEARNEEED